MVIVINNRSGKRYSYAIMDRVTVILMDRDGREKYRYVSEIGNGITDTGLLSVAARTGDAANVAPVSPYQYIAIGMGATPFDPSQTELELEIKRKQSATPVAALEDNPQQPGQKRARLHLSTEFRPVEDNLSGIMDISESGVFNKLLPDEPGVMMLCRRTFSPITVNWTAGDRLAVLWDIFFVRV